MNGWPSGQPTGGMFQQPSQNQLNASSMYNGLGNGAQFDFSQGLPNGSGGTPAPSFPNQQTFQPGSVVPAKRPHDGMSGSPVQQSRSQTPGFNFPNQQQGGGQQFPNAPTPFSHLQQPGSNNATPSPTMSNQQFRPPTQQPQQRMQNASPSPYVQQPQQQQGNFGNQMSPQNPNQGMNMQQGQMGNMGNMGQQFGMGANMNMQGQGNNMGANSAQRAYQQQLMEQQARMRGMMPQQRMGGQNSQMPGGAARQQMVNQMMNGQGKGQMNQAQMQRQAFIKTLANHAQQNGRPFNAQPSINGKPVDLYAIWTFATQVGGAQTLERMGHWPAVANKLGFPPSHFPNAAEELKQIYAANVGDYERLWLLRKQQQKQELARQHAHQMAGVGGPTQSSPTRSMQMANQQNQYPPFQQGTPSQQQPHATPTQASAQLPQNGMSTPQQQMLQHRRNSSVRRPEQMTPQTMGQPVPAPSPSVKPAQRSPSIKNEPSTAVMKSDEPQSSNYVPAARSIESDGGYDIPALSELGQSIAKARPDMPTVQEMGFIDVKAIKLSLASGIHSEVRYALDTLTILSHENMVQFDLGKSEDLMDVIIDCAEEQIDLLSEEAAEVSDALDLPSYEDVVRGSRIEAETLQEIPPFGSQAYDLDRAADKFIAIGVILRNFSFFEHNHPALTSAPVVKWLSNTIRLLGTRNMLLRTYFNAQDFYKDMVTFLSNVTQSLELPARDDALHVLHFLLAFAPQPAPSFTEGDGKVRFTSFVPSTHRYLPPAVDCLAKLLARQDPNRQLYRSIFTASSSSLATSESPLDLLTRAFALAISILPDRSKGVPGNSVQLRIVDARKAYITQGMLAADIITTLLPTGETELARSWIESEDGWAVGLLNLAALLSVDRSQMNTGPKGRELGMDTESFKLITHRALAMMKRLAEKAGKGAGSSSVGRALSVDGMAVNGDVKTEDAGDDKDASKAPKWEGIPQAHGILGALMIPQTDKVALGLLCGLHEMAMKEG